MNVRYTIVNQLSTSRNRITIGPLLLALIGDSNNANKLGKKQVYRNENSIPFTS